MILRRMGAVTPPPVIAEPVSLADADRDSGAIPPLYRRLSQRQTCCPAKSCPRSKPPAPRRKTSQDSLLTAESLSRCLLGRKIFVWLTLTASSACLYSRSRTASELPRVQSVPGLTCGCDR